MADDFSEWGNGGGYGDEWGDTTNIWEHVYDPNSDGADSEALGWGTGPDGVQSLKVVEVIAKNPTSTDENPFGNYNGENPFGPFGSAYRDEEDPNFAPLSHNFITDAGKGGDDPTLWGGFVGLDRSISGFDSKVKEDVKKDSKNFAASLPKNPIVTGLGNSTNDASTSKKDKIAKPAYTVVDSSGIVIRDLTEAEVEELKKNGGSITINGRKVAFVVVDTGKDGSKTLMTAEDTSIFKKNAEEGMKQVDTWMSQYEASESAYTDAPDADGISEGSYNSKVVRTFDLRLARLDSFLASSNGNSVIVPFSSETAASCFSDMVFTISNEQVKAVEKSKGRAQKALDNINNKSNQETIEAKTAASAAKDIESTKNSKLNEDGNSSGYSKSANGKLDPNWNKFKSDGALHGVASLMNPYSITRLYGALGTIKAVNIKDGNNGYLNSVIAPETNMMYDIRDQRRFYDVTVESNENEDLLAVTTPTTSNIIKWSNKDTWGRTPYGFSDFVFCKYWNIIPNNRLLTLRKYASPTYDNLNFEGMVDSNDNPAKEQDKTFAPLATVVSYFGGETGNTLENLLNISAGIPWSELKADIWTVNGDQGSNQAQVVDDVINNNNYFDSASNIPILGALVNSFGGISKDINSFGKFLGITQQGGFSESADNATKYYENLKDPYQEGPFNNRILGPVNKISKTMSRAIGNNNIAEDLKFQHDIKLVCEYVARPIGGVNTKAAMLDILANLLEIGSASAVFWGGGHRFQIRPSAWPWKGADGQEGILKKLYQGKIFGKDGALYSALQGIVGFGKDGNGNFSWDTVTQKLQNVFQGVVGAIGQAVNTIASSIGVAEDLVSGAVDKAEQMIGGVTGDPESVKKAQKKGAEQMTNLFNNTQELIKSKMIRQSTLPHITGMRAILIGIPVGNWHLTIGNPLNPIAVIGNLVCENMQLQFSDELGPDDFPMELKCTFTLKHGMARDKDAIESMFNRGAGKIYNLPDSLRASSDMETKVDKYTGTSSWRMGYSYASGASSTMGGGALGNSGRYVKLSNGTELATHGNAATTFMPKFQPVNLPDSANWEEVKANGEFLTPENRAIFRANLATRKNLI